VVIVTGTLAPGHLQRFTDAFAPLAQHVAQHEDGCLAYELSVKSGEPDAFVIYERCVRACVRVCAHVRVRACVRARVRACVSCSHAHSRPQHMRRRARARTMRSHASSMRVQVACMMSGRAAPAHTHSKRVLWHRMPAQ
jgi:hypothetical protein